MGLEMIAVDGSAGPLRADTLATFRRLLVPVHYNAATQCAIAEAIQLYRHFGSEVHLFRYLEPDEASHIRVGTGAHALHMARRIEEAEDRLRRFVASLFPGHEKEMSFYASVGTGLPDAVIAEAARVDATLVLIGVDPRPHLFRTEVERLVQRLPCPVFLVRTYPAMRARTRPMRRFARETPSVAGVTAP
jgi:nucleotide-binding universal stress UspA family protein